MHGYGWTLSMLCVGWNLSGKPASPKAWHRRRIGCMLCADRLDCLPVQLYQNQCLCADGGCESTQDGARHTRRLAWQGHLQSYAGDWVPLRLQPPAGKIDLLLSATSTVPSYIIPTSSVPFISATEKSKATVLRLKNVGSVEVSHAVDNCI